MRRRTNASNQLITAAYVSAIVPGSAADRLHGELSEGKLIRGAYIGGCQGRVPHTT